MTLLRITALLTAVGALAQFLLGGFMFTADYSAGLWTVHGYIGLATIVAGVVASVAAFINKKNGGNPGLAFHVLGTTVLIVVQYALGEIGGFVVIHMVIGIAILISAIAMATLAFRKPFARR